jgi:hypothetical protein
MREFQVLNGAFVLAEVPTQHPQKRVDGDRVATRRERAIGK